MIGAGAAGLSSALALQDMGHAVTVYEKEARPGGKCFSVMLGSTCVDLGAVMVFRHGAVAQIAARMGRRLIEINHDEHPSLAGLDLAPVYSGARTLAVVAFDLVRLDFLYQAWRRRELRANDALPEDRMTILDYLEVHRLKRLAPITRALLSAYGYGFAETTTASYFLSYYTLLRPYLFRVRKRGATVEGGYEALWRDVAGAMDIRYSTAVTRVERGAQCVVSTQEGRDVFDAVVLACTPEALASVIDADAQELALLGRTETVDYHSLVFEGPGITGCYVQLPDWCRPEDAGRPMLWYRPREGGFCHAWTIAAKGASLPSVDERVRTAAERLGAVTGRTLAHRCWTYFPHFGLEMSAAGARQKLRSWQGRRNGYFVGELFSFASAEHVVIHAQALMRASFKPA